MTVREFKNDQRGAILLVGLLMGFVLTCSLSYVITVSESILHQERLQTAADAIAFQSAVMHARGMNTLAFINMAMAVALVVIVAFRIVELVIIIATIICAIPTLGTCIAPGAQALLPVVQMEARIGMEVFRAISWAGYAEQAVALATPYWATGRGLQDTTAFYRARGVVESNPYSLSLLPTTLDAGLAMAQDVIKPRLGTKLGQTQAGINLIINQADIAETIAEGWPSLPVEAGEFEKLCGRTGEFLTTQIQATQLPIMAIELVGPEILPDKAMEAFDTVNQITRTMGGQLMGIEEVAVVLCEPLMSMVNRLIQSITGASPLMQRPPGLDAKKWSPGMIFATIENFINTKTPFKGTVKMLGGVSANQVKTAELWSLADNGNLMLRTWASVGNVAQSRWAFARDTTPQPGQAVASAEYYAKCFDFTQNLPSFVAGAMRSCAEDSMWRIGWTARMRRVRPIRSEFSAADLSLDVIGEAMKEVLPFGETPFGGSVIDFLLEGDRSPFAEPIGTASGAFDNAFEDLVGAQVDRAIGPAPDDDTIIH